MTEQLEHSVPSVLDSAVAILAAPDSQDDDLDSISIVAPALPDAGYQSGFTSPISRMSSRSPSPTGMGNRRSLLLSASPLQTTSPLQGSPPFRPTIQANNAPPAPLPPISATPTSAYYSASSTAAASEAGSEASSPTTATHHEHPLHALPGPQATITIPNNALPHPPSPKNATKRLSFLSYMDLLSSTPASTLPLSSLTSSAVASDPPPHLPSVIGFPQAQYAASSSAGSFHASPASILDRDAAVGILDDVGGEWEREGLGRGLEERLEALNTVTVAPGKA